MTRNKRHWKVESGPPSLKQSPTPARAQGSQEKHKTVQQPINTTQPPLAQIWWRRTEDGDEVCSRYRRCPRPSKKAIRQVIDGFAPFDPKRGA